VDAPEDYILEDAGGSGFALPLLPRLMR
jgi:hypothetical protein